MLPQSEFESPMFANDQAPVAIAALTQDRALIGLLRSTVDPTTDVLLVNTEDELRPHLNSRRVSVALLDSMFIEEDLGALAERLRDTWPDLVLVVVGTAEEQSKVTSQITSGVVYRFLHRPVSAPRVRLFVEAALRRHEVENVERTLEQTLPVFAKQEAAAGSKSAGGNRARLLGFIGVVAVLGAVGAWFLTPHGEPASGSAPAAIAPVVSKPVAQAPEVAAAKSDAPRATPPEEKSLPAPVVPPPASPVAERAAPTESVAERLRQDSSTPIQLPAETAPLNPPPTLTREQRLREQLAQAEAALQRGELASPRGQNAVELFRGALDMDPGNTLAKAGLVRVADRLLSAAERALTAGNPEDARSMVAVAESLTPATARGAFLIMQIEMEHERAALTRAKDSDLADKQDKGATYLRLANARIRSGALIEPSEDNARFYLEAARQIVPDDPAVSDTSRALQKQLLDRASTAATSGDAADTERWLANADGAGAARPDMTAIRRSLQDTLISARADKSAALAQSFTTALSTGKLLQPADASAKAYLLALINLDAGNPTVAGARQSLGSAYLRELRSALARSDLAAADTWLSEARTIGFSNDELNATEGELGAARAKAAAQPEVVGANSLQRLEYVAPKFPAASRNRGASGWVELEFTVRADGSTGDIVVTNSSPRKTFDSVATAAVSEWRYKPMMRDGKPVEQRAAVRIRFSDE